MDREKVIYDIERCICHVPDACRDCSHYGHGEVIGCMEELLTDVLALLKEREAVRHDLFICPVCKNALFEGQKFCHECGQAVKWE